VIRENPVTSPGPRSAPADRDSGAPPAAGGGWDASAVTPQEVAAVRRFLERRESLDAPARQALARRLAEGLSGKVSGASPGIPDEQFLEQLTRSKLG